MRNQLSLDLKNHVPTVSSAVILITLLVILLGHFFSAQAEPDYSSFQMFGAYSTASGQATATLRILKQTKAPTSSQKQQMAVLRRQLAYFDQISLEYAGTKAIPPTATVQTITPTILKLRRFELKQARAGLSKYLAPISYPGQLFTGQSLAVRRALVRQNTILVRERLGEIPTTKTDAPAPNYLLNFFAQPWFPVLLLAALAVHCGWIMTADKRDATIYLSNMVPLPKAKLWVTRLLSCWLVTASEGLVALGLTFGLTGIKFGWGSWRYPLFFGPDYHLMSIGTYTAKLLLLFMAGTFLLVVVSGVLALVSGQLGVNLMGLGILLLTSLPAFLNLTGVRAVARLLPGASLNLNAVVLEQSGSLADNYWSALGITVVWCLIGGLVGVAIIRHRQRL